MFPQPSGRFGSALAVLDFNKDGLPDLAVGAPSVGSGQLTYNVSLGGRQRWRGGGWSSVPGKKVTGTEREHVLGRTWARSFTTHSRGYRLGDRDKNAPPPPHWGLF